MTVLSRFLSFFPLIALLGICASLVAFIITPSVLTLVTLAFAVYGLPLCVFRLLHVLFPITEGFSHLDERRYSPWWGSHQTQAIYIAIPQLEAVLRLIPGAFSGWLRLWGSRVGASVYWTPRVEIVDRNLLDIGDRVIFGDKVECWAHVIKPKDGRLSLYVKRVQIGHNVFLGAGSRIGPGASIADGASVPILAILFPNQKVLTQEDRIEIPDAV